MASLRQAASLLSLFLTTTTSSAASLSISRLHAQRYVASPDSERPTFPTLATEGGVVSAALVGTTVWFVGASGDVYCCESVDDLSDNCALAPVQLSGGATDIRTWGAWPNNVTLGLASPSAAAMASVRGACQATTVAEADVDVGEVGGLALAKEEEAEGAPLYLYAGGSSGALWRLAPGGETQRVAGPFDDGTPITALALQGPTKVAVATKVALYRKLSADKWRTEFLLTLFDSDLSALSFDNDAAILWAGGNASFYSIDVTNGSATNGWVTRIGGGEGAPVAGGVRCICQTRGGAVVFGTDQGVASWSPSEGAWSLLAGERYLPGGSNAVGALATASSSSGRGVGGGVSMSSVVVAVLELTGAVAVLRTTPTTLAAKAAFMEEELAPRHRLWHGLVGPAMLAAPGDAAQVIPGPDDNNGLWTGIALAAQSFRFAASSAASSAAAAASSAGGNGRRGGRSGGMGGALEDPNVAQAAADATFDALAALSAVTGVEGFPARSLAAPDDEVPANPAEHWGWNDSPTLEGWRFLGNTSSDEIVGHVLAYSLYHDLVPPDSNSSYSSLGDRGGDSDRQQQAADLLVAIVSNVVDSGYKLIDVNGEPTKWGFWDPKSLNGGEHADERGVNSLQMLSMLLAAHRVRPVEKFATAFDHLIDEHAYDLNLVNQLVATPEEINYSDVGLSFLPFYTVAHACRPSSGNDDDSSDGTLAMCDRARPFLVASLERSYAVVSKQHSALWDFIYGAATLIFDIRLDERRQNSDRKQINGRTSSSDGGVAEEWREAGLKCLVDYPWDLVEWAVDNGRRPDLRSDASLLPSVNQSTTSIRRSESNALKWFNNPFDFENDQGGLYEEDPTFFLVAYWLARYHGFVAS